MENSKSSANSPRTQTELTASLCRAYRAYMEELVKPLKEACDRNWKDENPAQIVAIAANTIHWRRIAPAAQAVIEYVRRHHNSRSDKLMQMIQHYDEAYLAWAELSGDSPRPESAILHCPHCHSPARKIDWCADYRSPHVCPTDHFSHQRPDLFCPKCGGTMVQVGAEEDGEPIVQCSHQLAHEAEAPHQPTEEILSVLVMAREALLRADSMLSLLRHRGGIQAWGSPGFPREYEADAVIGETRRAWNSLLRFLSKGKERILGKGPDLHSPMPETRRTERHSEPAKETPE